MNHSDGAPPWTEECILTYTYTTLLTFAFQTPIKPSAVTLGYGVLSHNSEVKF